MNHLKVQRKKESLFLTPNKPATEDQKYIRFELPVSHELFHRLEKLSNSGLLKYLSHPIVSYLDRTTIDFIKCLNGKQA